MATYTLSQLTALRNAIALGARRVEYSENGRSNAVTYHSLAEMQTLLEAMEKDLGVGAAAARPKGAIYFSTSNGLRGS